MRNALQALAGGRHEASLVDGSRAKGEQHPPRLGDRLRQPVEAQRQLLTGSGSAHGRQIGAGVQVLLGADEELGHAVMQVVGDAAALLLLGHDDFLHQAGHGVGMGGPPSPGSQHGIGHGQDEEHLKRVEEQGQPGASGLEGAHLQQLVRRDRHEGHGQDDLVVTPERRADERPPHAAPLLARRSAPGAASYHDRRRPGQGAAPGRLARP
jgi:hypothetical protein